MQLFSVFFQNGLERDHEAVLKKKKKNLENRQSTELIVLTIKLHEREELRDSEKGPENAESVNW